MPEVAHGNLSSGADPLATFPNAHLARVGWSAPKSGSPVQELQEAVAAEDWNGNFAEGKTKFIASAAWSADGQRCNTLQCLCTTSRAKRVLEVGGFCGVATLAMAEAIPKDGQVISLELDPFFVQIGEKYRLKSTAGPKIAVKIGPAMESLEDLAKGVKDGSQQGFDFVVLDGDKGNLKAYFELLWSTPGMLTERAVLCVDMTPFKGQPPIRYTRFGQADKWEAKSGQEEMEAMRAQLTGMSELVVHEFQGLLVAQRAT